MKILITGSTGFIGRELIVYLRNRHELICLGLYSENFDDCIFDNCKIIKTDYSYNDLIDKLPVVDGIIHLAFQKASSENENGGMTSYFPSIQLSENLIKVAKEKGISNVVTTSSRCVYGTYTNDMFCEEDQTNSINYYGVAKICVEQLFEYYNTTYNLNYKSLRLGQVIGKELKENSVFTTFFKNAIANLPLTITTNDIRDYVYITDVCKAINVAIEHTNHRGIYNVSIGKGYSNRDLAENIIDILDSDSTIETKNDSDISKTTRIILNNNKFLKTFNYQCEYDIQKIIHEIKNNIE